MLVLGNLYQVRQLWQYLPEVSEPGQTNLSAPERVVAVISGASQVLSGQAQLPGDKGRWYFGASRPILHDKPGYSHRGISVLLVPVCRSASACVGDADPLCGAGLDTRCLVCARRKASVVRAHRDVVRGRAGVRRDTSDSHLGFADPAGAGRSGAGVESMADGGSHTQGLAGDGRPSGAPGGPCHGDVLSVRAVVRHRVYVARVVEGRSHSARGLSDRSRVVLVYPGDVPGLRNSRVVAGQSPCLARQGAGRTATSDSIVGRSRSRDCISHSGGVVDQQLPGVGPGLALADLGRAAVDAQELVNGAADCVGPLGGRSRADDVRRGGGAPRETWAARTRSFDSIFRCGPCSAWRQRWR